MHDKAIYRAKDIIGRTHFTKRSDKKDIFIFATRRGGSTLLMEMIYCQKGINFVSQPLDMTRYNPYQKSLPNVAQSKFIHFNDDQQEQLKWYFRDIVLRGKLRGRSQWRLWNGDYSFKVERLVVKILNGKPLMNWFAENFEAKTVYILRHPIPVALSIMEREWACAAEAFLNNIWFRESILNSHLISVSEEIIKNGTPLQKYVLEWCLENLYPLTISHEKDVLTITYEELVLRSQKMSAHICNYLELPDAQKAHNRLLIPARTTVSNSKNDIVEKGSSYLLKRWKNKIDNETEAQVMEILEEFGIEVYKKGSVISSDNYCHFGSLENELNDNQ